KTQFSVTAGSLSFSAAPGLPTLGAVTLNGAAQTTNSTMTNLGVADATGSGSEGYVSGGQTLAANSLTLNSTGASFAAQSGTTGTAPALQCSTACNVD